MLLSYDTRIAEYLDFTAVQLFHPATLSPLPVRLQL